MENRPEVFHQTRRREKYESIVTNTLVLIGDGGVSERPCFARHLFIYVWLGLTSWETLVRTGSKRDFFFLCLRKDVQDC